MKQITQTDDGYEHDEAHWRAVIENIVERVGAFAFVELAAKVLDDASPASLRHRQGPLTREILARVYPSVERLDADA